MCQKFSSSVDRLNADVPECRSVRRRLLVWLPCVLMAVDARAQNADASSLDAEQRLRLRRELRQAHRPRETEGHTMQPVGTAGDGGQSEPPAHSEHTLRRGPPDGPPDTGRPHGPWPPPGHGASNPHGFGLSADERRDLRRQLREQHSAARATSGASAPVQSDSSP